VRVRVRVRVHVRVRVSVCVGEEEEEEEEEEVVVVCVWGGTTPHHTSGRSLHFRVEVAVDSMLSTIRGALHLVCSIPRHSF
jgi:hypothetical protein